MCLFILQVRLKEALSLFPQQLRDLELWRRGNDFSVPNLLLALRGSLVSHLALKWTGVVVNLTCSMVTSHSMMSRH